MDARIIQEAQNIAIQKVQEGGIQNILIPVNYSALLSQDEHQLSYFTQDVGLAAYYSYINLAGYILGEVNNLKIIIEYLPTYLKKHYKVNIINICLETAGPTTTTTTATDRKSVV